MKLFARNKKMPSAGIKKNTYLRDIRKNWQLYIMELIPLVFVIVFAYGAMYGIQLAFKQYSARLGIWGSPWVGFRYFERFLNTPWFTRTLFNTLKISIYSLVASLPFPIILALCVNAMTNKKLKKVVQTVSYLPHFISVVVLCGMIIMFFNSRVGFLGKIVYNLTDGKIDNIMSMPQAFSHIYVWSGIWQGMGWGSITYLALLSNVSEEQSEAAIIDGATRFQRVIHVDLPAIIPNIIISLIMSVGSLLNVGYEKILLLQNDLNLSASEVISTYSYKVGLLMGSGDFSYGMAIGLFNGIISFVLLIIVNKVARKLTETSLW